MNLQRKATTGPNRAASANGSPAGVRCLVAEGHRDVYEQVYLRQCGHRAPLRDVLLPRLRAGGVALVVYAVCGDTLDHAEGTDRPMWAALEHIDQFLQESEQPVSQIKPVLWREDLDDVSDGQIHFLLHFEGGSPLDGSLAALRGFYRLGLRSMQLVHNRRNELGDGVAERGTGGGLTTTGESVVREMERLGMVVDLAHASEATFYHALRVCRKPVVVSHSNCAAVSPHVRNLTDAQLVALSETGALVGVNTIAAFVDAERATVERLVDHIEHLAKFIGIDHVYVGGDATKHEGPRSLRDVRYASPEGVFVERLEEADQYPNLANALLRRGHGDADVSGVMGGNLIRYLREILPSRMLATVSQADTEAASSGKGDGQ